ncbi:hypothetical protein SETIT_8G077700v2 [Setaria italica]|uniref:Uncharacterized protein n=1 Tax=Setaria italica TaxID=4555 RepID=A0A368S5A9_SETIT|nr:hypothetical protein SETIT_8G077700v2 [Setaria italica]
MHAIFPWVSGSGPRSSPSGGSGKGLPQAAHLHVADRGHERVLRQQPGRVQRVRSSQGTRVLEAPSVSTTAMPRMISLPICVHHRYIP